MTKGQAFGPDLGFPALPASIVTHDKTVIAKIKGNARLGAGESRRPGHVSSLTGERNDSPDGTETHKTFPPAAARFGDRGLRILTTATALLVAW